MRQMFNILYTTRYVAVCPANIAVLIIKMMVYYNKFRVKKKGGGGENRVSILHLSSISSITLVVVAIDLPHRRYCRTPISKRYRRSLIEKWI